MRSTLGPSCRPGLTSPRSSIERVSGGGGEAGGGGGVVIIDPVARGCRARRISPARSSPPRGFRGRGRAAPIWRRDRAAQEVSAARRHWATAACPDPCPDRCARRAAASLSEMISPSHATVARHARAANKAAATTQPPPPTNSAEAPTNEPAAHLGRRCASQNGGSSSSGLGTSRMLSRGFHFRISSF
jgi:hypothetical protein